MPSPQTPSEIAHSLVPVRKTQARLMLEAGYLYMDMRNFEKSREVLVGAAALMPKSEVPQIALGTLELVQGRHDKALAAFRVAQRLAPTSSLPRAHAGEALLFLGKTKEAVKELKAALDLEPEGDGARLAQTLLAAQQSGLYEPRPSAQP